MLDLPQQENSNRENPMKSFKIEYVDGVLTVLETIAHDIGPAPAAESAQEPLVGELVQDQQSPFPGGRRSRHRRGGKQ